ncbi:hypothetical protein [Gilvibacter sediminis]|uniref:hypothetical protein n=1 Tax=Gilvibacter sediminis TaxID=379071 RepID=UPI00234FF68C|nr:hypothetical protein [Gilvibacter sediminis]MDC7997270.1 hypothetical protein [Gilvibacter sediminis]
MQRLKSLLFVLFITVASIGFAQQTYTINGESLSLKTEVSGTIDLLWNTFNKQYRYFVKKDGQYYELINTRVDGKYQEQYKSTLNDLTTGSGLSTDRLRMTLAGLRNFINDYNASVDPNYDTNSQTVAFETRLGFFGGVTNNRYTANPQNATAPLVGIEFEILDSKLLPRHAIVFQFRQSFAVEDFDYSASQLSLNYRFKFVKSAKVDVFANARLATYTYSRTVITNTDPAQNSVDQEITGGNLQAPILLGLGADIKLGKGYLMLAYNDIVGLTIDDNGEFPVDFTLGCKFNL